MRNLPQGFAQSIAQNEYHYVFFLEFQFRSEIDRFCTAPYKVKWQGLEWIGGGDQIGIGPIETTNELRAPDYNITLNYDTEKTPYVEKNEYLNRACYAHFSLLNLSYQDAVDPNDPDDPRLLFEPMLILDGNIDYADIREANEGGEIIFRVTNKLDILNIKSNYRYTHEHQQILYPGAEDGGLLGAAKIGQRRVFWGGGDGVRV